MGTIRTEVERLIREHPDDPRVALLYDGLTWAKYAAGELTKRGRPRGKRKGLIYRPRPTLAQVLWEPGTSPTGAPGPSNVVGSGGGLDTST